MKRKKDEPITSSLLDTDFYKFTMGQLIFRSYPNVEVEFGLINRSGDPLAKFILEEELRNELNQVRNLRFNNSELHYLRGTNEYGERMFGEDYLQFLQNLQLPPYRLERVGDSYRLSFTGPWAAVTYWETPALYIVTELRYRSLMNTQSRFDQDVTHATGVSRLQEKIGRLREYPAITFSDFGTRRRFSGAWHDYLVGVLAEELPNQFRGTSNVRLAMKHGLLPMGTSAHELPMVIAALAFAKADETQDPEETLAGAQQEVLQGWWNLYGPGLSIALTDTFGSPFFFRTAPEYVARDWKGTRQDSGSPFSYGEEAIKWYAKYGVDPLSKLTVFSDQLDVQRMVDLHLAFRGRLGHTFGWGTNLTNDVGFNPISIVIKTLKANGRSTVKLSDNLAKAMGGSDEVERYKRAAGYTNTESVKCVS
ncbi:nicotinate phosphoribosyltransferase [candidate division WWE3 bacterium RBG_19FT_COMBO_53_11]|uniref:Nicotinate phosphoribosyltransferase n=1 Tax=candidate division WWE3 bacterium RBG_19FT_COMBO_53_11 TaxID=1802613 RepID=A0A1F4UI48_UNCKA|nr:MAG: nicotinate phosphoribosyltransferase [candidate division WWE3 bacterium RBG_16_52_45]OGC44641.1 MAG: nicotinate phosphoribosyltransferase [candidate division WWE3 bacterium RBG_19FT_COMBO_53_11]